MRSLKGGGGRDYCLAGPDPRQYDGECGDRKDKETKVLRRTADGGKYVECRDRARHQRNRLGKRQIESARDWNGGLKQQSVHNHGANRDHQKWRTERRGGRTAQQPVPLHAAADKVKGGGDETRNSAGHREFAGA